MIGWLDCSSGVSGDMLLGALVDVGVELAVLQSSVDAVTPERVTLRAERVTRAGLAATKVHVDGTESTVHRRLADIRTLLEAADALPTQVSHQALAVFERVAAAEARVHGSDPEEVHFHEVGALDAIADVVATCAGLHALGLSSLAASPVALGGGSVQAAHGRLPVPGPAVVELLAGAPTFGGPVDVELTTPTGAALLSAAATSFDRQPPMIVQRQGFGAGARDLPGHPNVLRLVLGTPTEGPSVPEGTASDAVLVESNVDDLDPRLWPSVLSDLIDAGASDAWLTPILMKKGRPAHTLSALVAPGRLDDVERLILTSTSTIGLRRTAVAKRALERRSTEVSVGRRPVSVKLALLDGEVVNAQPEYEDCAAAASALGRPLKTVMAQALAAFYARGEPDGAGQLDHERHESTNRHNAAPADPRCSA